MFLTNSILNIFDDFQENIYLFSPSLHQDLYQKSIKCFNAFLPLNVIQNIINENISIENLDSIINELINDPDFESPQK